MRTLLHFSTNIREQRLDFQIYGILRASGGGGRGSRARSRGTPRWTPSEVRSHAVSVCVYKILTYIHSFIYMYICKHIHISIWALCSSLLHLKAVHLQGSGYCATAGGTCHACAIEAEVSLTKAGSYESSKQVLQGFLRGFDTGWPKINKSTCAKNLLVAPFKVRCACVPHILLMLSGKDMRQRIWENFQQQASLLWSLGP